MSAEKVDPFKAALVLLDLRKRGWRVATHNDYTADDGTEKTFWLMIHAETGCYRKAWGTSDLECLQAIAAGHP